MTRIHVVTPTFNSAKTIARTLMSVANQAGSFELSHHIQDGGSTDETMEIVRAWQASVESGAIPLLCEKFEVSVTSERDAGMYDAIWKGFKRSPGDKDDWLAWINSDDILNPGVGALLAAIDRQHNRSWMRWVGGSQSVAYYDGLTVGCGRRPLNNYVIGSGMCDGIHWDFVQQEGIFFRRSLWDSVDTTAGFAKLRFAGDWNLWRMFAARAELFQVDWPTGTFFRTQGQISDVSRDKYIRETDCLVSRPSRLAALRNMTDEQAASNVLLSSYLNGEIFHRLESFAPRLADWRKRAKLVRSDSGDDEAPPPPVVDVTVTSADGVISVDGLWQRPAITEEHANLQMRRAGVRADDATYLGFPWATMIDLSSWQDDIALPPDRMLALTEAFCRVRALPKQSRVVTVCQHINMLAHEAMFADLGVTDVFWSHAVTGQACFPLNPQIRIHPFPLYPVVQPDAAVTEVDRDVLFSFVGSKGSAGYLTNVRQHIIDLLADDEQALIVSRDGWHFQRQVYDAQIYVRSSESANTTETEQRAAYQNILQRSVFSLCPSGTGPNSIRLWESLMFGAIPVILAETHRLPGAPDLWRAAAIFCNEDEASVRALPDRLRAIVAEPGELDRMRTAMRQLVLLYGPDGFIADVNGLLLGGEPPLVERPQSTAINAATATLLARLKRLVPTTFATATDAGPFLLACGTQAMKNSEALAACLRADPDLRAGLRRAVQVGSTAHVDTLKNIMASKGYEKLLSAGV